jgi:23S rRNA (uracil1939-C5)-methyltransferase
MTQRRNIPFKISSMDSLGQGVSKISDKITFISKAMVGDAGEAEVLSEKKNIAFAQVKTFSELSPLRIKPVCPHFESCPSCHYLHVPYEIELKSKQQSLESLLHKIKTPEIETIGSPQRLGYRNRVQLHYDIRTKKLGMLDNQRHNIIPIPECSVALPPIQKEIERLYQQDRWLSEAPKNSKQGHVEIYWINDQLKISWNKPYASGGFTQVFDLMNQKLKNILTSWSALQAREDLIDLFAGNGNLSKNLNYSNRLCVDVYSRVPGEDFISQDLYHPLALKNITAELNKRKISPANLLLDPPRSGFKDLNLWLETMKPSSVAYVSCDPHTLARDVGSLTHYTVSRVFLIDFFPSTFHFETMLFLERKT